MGLDVLAPISGKVLEIYVQVGDEVKEDDELLSLESMKMQNPIYSDSSGVVKEVKTKLDDEVKEDQLLMILE